MHNYFKSLAKKLSDMKIQRKHLFKNKIVTDFSLNIVASIIVTFTTSIIVNPYLAKVFSAEDYGLILTLLGITAILTNAFGNSLNNVRLIDNNEAHYADSCNYNNLIIFMGILGSILIFCVSLFYYHSSKIVCVLLSLHTVLSILNAYYIVAFRIKLNYINNLIYACIISGGYIGSLIIISKMNLELWPIIYLVGDAIGLAYLMCSSNLIRERYKLSKNIINVMKKYSILILTTLLANLLLYLDRLIIYPKLGGESVAIYATAAFYGKCLGLIMGPIANVMLSYFAKYQDIMTRKVFWKINLLCLLLAIIVIISSLFIAPIITLFLYPTLYDIVTPYLLVGNIAAVIGILSTVANPAILKFCNMKWQLFISISYGIIYILLAEVLIDSNGLWGFAISAIISNLFKLILTYFIGHKFLRKESI